MGGLKKFSHILFCVATLLLMLWLSFFAGPRQGRNNSITISILCIVFVFSVVSDTRRIKHFTVDRVNSALWLYVFMVTFGVFFARNRQVAIHQYITYVIPIPFIYYLFKNEFSLLKEKDSLFVVMCVCASVVASIAILEFLFHKNIIYERLVSNLYYRYYLSQHRAMSTQLVPQVMGTYLAAFLPAAYHFILSKRGKFFKVLGIASAALIIIGMFCSGQRVAMVAFILSSIIYFWLKDKKTALIFSIFILALLLTLSVAKSPPLRRINLQGLMQPSPYRYRINRLYITMKMVKDYPLSGIGLGHYKLIFDRYGNRFTNYYMKTPENMYLMILCETGVISFLSFILFLSFLLHNSFSYVILKLKDSEPVLVLTSGLVAILVSMLTYDALYWTVPFYMFWIYCGMLASLVIPRP